MRLHTSALLAAFPGLAAAWAAPTYNGMTVVFQDDFTGAAGDSPDSSIWNIALNLHNNNEVEEYSSSNANIQISGGSTLQLVPWKTAQGSWTSGRIEGVGSYTPAAGKVMRFEALIRFGTDSQATKQGIWPAFWLLGDSMRHGTPWPLCGELDIMEQVDGVMTGYGTAHCGASDSGGPCNEPEGLSASVGIPDDGWHTWSLEIDRTAAAWESEVITWQLDGATYHTLTGATIGDSGTWAALAQSPMYPILNVAVGGNWPGAPNGETEGGYGAMMEVAYVAVYST